MNKKEIISQQAPAAIGPYSQAIMVGDLLFCSGVLGIDPTTNTLTPNISEQTTQVLHNMQAILAAAGLSLSNVVKTTVYLKNMDDFATMNSVYERFFDAPFPARVTIEVARLPKDALVEIDCIAHL